MKAMYSILTIIAILAIITVWVLNSVPLGRHPKGERLARIQKLPNYKNGELQNLSPTPTLPEGVSYWNVIVGMLKGNKESRPTRPIPTVRPDFSSTQNVKIIWFGHSSYLIQADGMNILVDPVLSTRTSPISFIGAKSFEGTDFIKAEELPPLDVILITHDHYDHLDYQTILQLKDKTKKFVTSLGVGAHLEHWGVAPDKIVELAWQEEASYQSLKFTAMPARHFSGRGFKRNQTVWSAFVLQTANKKLYLGGDSGYDKHFKIAGDQHGPFDIALLECGQYNDYWPLIHMSPEQTVQAATELQAKVLLPVHWGKFVLAWHDWDDPIKRVVKEARRLDFKITTPIMGESVILDKYYPQKDWWLELRAD
ncbi:MAG: MBL fold metallo-hydrolase [Pedobacter sp.]|nr:MAG: MBL fold metallo-hydrolase [Pedobacter sp.]